MIDGYTKPYRDEVDKVKRKTSEATAHVECQTAKMANAFNKVGSAVKLALGAAGIGAIAQFGKSCIKLGSDLAEVQNVVDVTFGNMSSKVNQFSKDAISQFGLSELSAKKYMGTYGAMAKAFGFNTQQAYDMSAAITGLTGDVASFYNLTTDEAYTKLKSIFSGETETLKELGVVMTQTALDQYAMNNGLGKTTAQMTEQEKVMLRYQFVMAQLGLAQGDFARTSNSWANQTRVLTLRFEQLKATLGQGLINVFTPVIKVLNAIIERLQVAADFFKAFTSALFGNAGIAGGGSGIGNPGIGNTGNDMGGDLSSGTGQAADNTGKITDDLTESAKQAKKIERALMSFDEINKLGEENDAKDLVNDPGSSGSNPSIPNYGGLPGNGVLDDIQDELEQVNEKAQAAAAKVKEFLGKLKEEAQPTIEAMKRLNESLEPFKSFIATGVKDFYKSFLVPVGKWVLGKGLPSLIDALINFIQKVRWSELNKSLNNLWKALAPFSISIGTGLIEFFYDLLDVGADFINAVLPKGLNNLAEAIKNIDPETVEKIGYSLGILLASLAAFKGLTWFAGIFGAEGAIGKGFALLSGHPFLSIAVGIGGIIVALDKFGFIDVDWDWLWSKLKQMKDILVEFVSRVDWHKLVNSIVSLFEALSPFVKGFADGFLDTFDFLLNQIGAPALNILASVLKGIADALNSMDPELLESIGKSIGIIAVSIAAIKITEGLVTKITGLYQALKLLKGILFGTAGGAFVPTGPAAGGAGLIGGGGTLLGAIKAIAKKAGGAAVAIGTLKEASDNFTRTSNSVDYSALLNALDSIKQSGEITDKQFNDLYGTLSTAQIKSVPFTDALIYTQDELSKAGVSVSVFEKDLMNSLEKLGVSAPEAMQKVGKSVGEGTAQGISESRGRVEDATKSLVQRIKELFTNKSDGFDIHSPSKFGYGVGGNVVAGLSNAFTDKWGELDNGLSKLLSGTKKSLNDSLDGIQAKSSNALGRLSKMFSNVHIPLPHFEINWKKISVGTTNFSLPSMNVKWYAKGGMPNTGEMFIARERGPELVGRMGNKNAVANNNQIVAGIKSGVFEAVSQAMNHGEKSSDLYITVEIGGEKLTEKVVKEYNKIKKSNPQFGIIV